jgi:hypothetical protein
VINLKALLRSGALREYKRGRFENTVLKIFEPEREKVAEDSRKLRNKEKVYYADILGGILSIIYYIYIRITGLINRSNFSGYHMYHLISSYLSIRPPIHPSIHSPIQPSTHQPIHPPTHPSIHPSIYPSIYLIIYLSMALQPFVGPCPLFQFLDLLHSR